MKQLIREAQLTIFHMKNNLGITQLEIANDLGVHSTTVSKIMLGKQKFVMADAKAKLEEWLDTLPDDQKPPTGTKIVQPETSNDTLSEVIQLRKRVKELEEENRRIIYDAYKSGMLKVTV
jgi:transcriptional regulator with XRE-family HTH domain